MNKESKEKYKDFKVVKAEVKNEMIDNIHEYLKNGTFPNKKPNAYMTAYTAVQTHADIGDKECAMLLEYHNGVIRDYIQDCLNDLSKETNVNLIDAFIKHTEHITFLSYWMNRIFCYLDRFYTKAKCKITLAKNALTLYTENFFNQFRNNIFIEVNKLIREDRQGIREYRPKIKIVMRIIKDLDYEFPKLIKENNKISWIQEKENSKGTEIAIQNDWYENYFLGDTLKFSRDKGKGDVQILYSPEYILYHN